MCILYALLSSQAKKRLTPYHVPGHDLLQLTHSGSPSSTQRRERSSSSRHGTSSAMPRFFAYLTRSSWHSLKLLLCHGLTAPSRSVLRLVGDDEAVVDADHAAEAAAGRARAERRIEREQRRRRRLVVDVAIGTMQPGRKAPDGFLRGANAALALRGAAIVILPDMDVHAPVADAQRRLQRLDDARALGAAAPESVGDDVENTASARVDPRIALPLEKRQHFRFGEVLGYRHRKRDDEPRVAGGRAALGQRFVDRLRRIADDLAAAAAGNGGPLRARTAA